MCSLLARKAPVERTRARHPGVPRRRGLVLAAGNRPRVARPYVCTIRALCRAKSTCGSYPMVVVLLAHGDLPLRTMSVCVQVVVTHVVLRSPAATASSGGPGPAPAVVPPSMGKTPSSLHRTPFARMGSNRVVPLGTLGSPYTSCMHTLMVANGLACAVRCLHSQLMYTSMNFD